MKTNSPGAFILLVIITAFIVCFVGTTLIILTTNQYRIINSEIERTKAFYRAQAGMEYAIYRAYTNVVGWLPSPPVLPAILNTVNHNNISVAGGTVNITITTPGTLSNYEIKITTNYTS